VITLSGEGFSSFGSVVTPLWAAPLWAKGGGRPALPRAASYPSTRRRGRARSMTKPAFGQHAHPVPLESGGGLSGRRGDLGGERGGCGNACGVGCGIGCGVEVPRGDGWRHGRRPERRWLRRNGRRLERR
jgi:hypothetical protein